MPVYFLHCALSGLTKIGKAKDVRKRVADIQRMSGAPLRVVAVIDGYSDEESSMHSRFYESRRHGEWFALDIDKIPPTTGSNVQLLGPALEAREMWPEFVQVDYSKSLHLAIEDIKRPSPRGYFVRWMKRSLPAVLHAPMHWREERRVGEFMKRHGLYWTDPPRNIWGEVYMTPGQWERACGGVPPRREPWEAAYESEASMSTRRRAA